MTRTYCTWIALTAFVFIASGISANTPKTSWEYTIVTIGNVTDATSTRLNELGEGGWELVSVVKNENDGDARLQCFLKRRKGAIENDRSVAQNVHPMPSEIAKRVVDRIPINKDCMILSYIPDWAHGNVDNIAVANNEGGVRVLIDWSEIPADLLERESVRFNLALYSRKTTYLEPTGEIEAYAIESSWGELTSWKKQPETSVEPVTRYPFIHGDGWKLFDITSLVRQRVVGNDAGHGVMIRFAIEDRIATPADWSGYQFVSREGENEWHQCRPVLLAVVD